MRALPLAAAVAAIVPVAAASAATSTYVARSFNEPTASGLAVTGPLKAYRASSRARVVVPTSWRALGAGAGKLRLRVVQNPACTFDITYSVRSVVGAAGDAGTRVTAALPAAGSRYVLDEGERGNRAWRVIRRPTSDGRVRMSALWNGVLTKRSDIVPAGKAAWTEIRAEATSRPGSECHSGTYRVSVGPAIGDSLAVARTTLHFAKP